MALDRGDGTMKIFARFTLLVAVFMMFGCEPEDQTPGLWLSGEPVETFPDDWSFSNDFQLIAIEVGTPYFMPHSVTIWCVEVDGDLYVAAAAADSKNWPGWIDDDPDVVLKIGEKVYETRLEPIENSTEIDGVRAAYVAKYNLGEGSPFQPGTRYWSVQPPESG